MKNLIVIFTAALFVFTSCNPKYYSPNTQNVPLISAQGEKNITVAANGNQVELQGAMGVTDKIALQLNGGLYIPKDQDNGNGGKGNFIEVGAGYFKEVQPNWVFETYALAGFGSFKNYLPSTIADNPGTKGDLSANIFRVGVQPNFGYKTKYFSAMVSSRFVNLSYSNIKGDLIFAGEQQLTYLKDNNSNFLIEPALTLRGGLEKVKLQVQYGYSFNVSNSHFRQDKPFLTVGLNFNFK